MRRTGTMSICSIGSAAINCSLTKSRKRRCGHDDDASTKNENSWFSRHVRFAKEFCSGRGVNPHRFLFSAHS